MEESKINLLEFVRKCRKLQMAKNNHHSLSPVESCCRIMGSMSFVTHLCSDTVSKFHRFPESKEVDETVIEMFSSDILLGFADLMASLHPDMLSSFSDIEEWAEEAISDINPTELPTRESLLVAFEALGRMCAKVLEFGMDSPETVQHGTSALSPTLKKSYAAIVTLLHRLKFDPREMHKGVIEHLENSIDLD